MNKKQKIKLIKDVWQKLDYVLQGIHGGNYGKEYLNLNIREEKNHDRSRPNGIRRGLSIIEASKLFAVRQIVEALTDEEKHKPKVKNYLYLRKSVFYAWALVENYKEEIEKALQGVNYDDVLALDYRELIK